MRPVFNTIIETINFRPTKIFILAGLFLFISLMVQGQPTATISGSATVCQGSSEPAITFTGADGTAPYSFNYTIDGGEVLTVSTSGSDNSTTINVPTNSSGTYVYSLVSVTDANPVTASVAGSATVTINALPLVTFSVQPEANACIGAEVILSTQESMTDYLWGFSAVEGTDYTIISGGTPSDNTVRLKYLTAGIRSVTINYTDSNGCKAATATSSIGTTVNPLPAPSAIYHY
jgi:hypothetical protein